MEQSACLSMLLLLSSCWLICVNAGAMDCGYSTARQNSFFTGARLVGNKIIGGNVASGSDWPWMASILQKGLPQCGGTLIGDRWVLTAAHCLVKNLNPADYQIELGSTWLIGRRGTIHDAVKFIVHPQFNRIFPRAFDYALIQLGKPVVMVPNVTSPICLPVLAPYPRRACVTAGWGRLHEAGPRSPLLLETVVPIIPFWECNGRNYYHGRIYPTTMFCAGYPFGGKDACQGDSGGPLMCPRNEHQWELAGVVSWGFGCGRPKRPGVYSNVLAMKGWILTQIAIHKG